MWTNPVLVSVLVMVGLCLVKLNVLLALILAALAGGLLAGMPLGEVMSVLVGGMGGNSETALSYILLGALAFAFNKTGVAELLVKRLVTWIKGRGTVLVGAIAFVSCFSQNLIPVHIAFIPILIPPLLKLMDSLEIDRRAVACALTFGVKAPYVALPIGYGLIFHNIIRDQMIANGMPVATQDIWPVMWFPGLAMLIGLLIAMFWTYRKPRSYDYVAGSAEAVVAATSQGEVAQFNKDHLAAILGGVVALVIQLRTGSLPLGATIGLAIMWVAGAIKWSDFDELIDNGIGMMGFIAFVMLVAAGYGAVIRATGGVEQLVQATVGLMGGSKAIAAFLMLFIGLVITMGIGTSFGTIPVIAAIYVPLAATMGFSPAATILIIGVAGALGDAGSPASDSTLGPTAGLNADGKHDHIWDTCVPTFIHFNIPLLIAGVIGAVILG
ncbi:MAG: Na+/H+ antiporter family protein [Limnochordia bacterium]|jgi:predicted histidine transporter YuiF (NhaC family)